MNRLWHYRKFILGTWIALTIASSVWLAFAFRVDNSVGVWFAEDDAALKTYRTYLEDWGEREWTLAMIHCDDVRNTDLRPELQALGDRIEKQEHVSKVLSIASLPPGHPLAEELFLRPGNPNHTLLLIQTANFFQRQDPYRHDMLEQIRTELTQAKVVNEYHIAGTSVVNAALNRAAVFDMVLFFTLVTILLTLSSRLLMRSWRDTIVLLAIALSTVGLTLGLICISGYSLNIVTIMLPTILIALSTADAVHIIHAFHAGRKTMPAQSAATAAVREIWLPCLGTTVTTVAGFLSLAGSAVLPVFQLAVFCSFGITCAWLVSVLVAPILLNALWGRSDSPPPSAARTRHVEGWLQKAIQHPKIIICCFVLLCTALAGLGGLKADTNYVRFFPADADVPKTYAALEEVGFPQSPLVILLDTSTNPHQQAEFVKRLEQLPQVQNVVAPAPGLSEMLGLVSDDGKHQRMFLLTSYLGSQELLRLVEQVESIQQTSLPNTPITITGTTMLWANMDSSVIDTQVDSLLIIAPLMLVVLCVLFRSIILGVVGWILSCLPVAMIMGLMGFLGIEINIATVLIAGVTLGLAVDDAIHLIFSFQENLRNGQDSEAAAIGALNSSGMRIAFTTLIVMGGFACMSISNFHPTSNFGILTCLTIFIAAVLDLTLLALILIKIGPRISRDYARFDEQADAENLVPQES